MRCHLIIINNKNIYVNVYVIWIYDSFVSQFSSFQNRMSTRIVLRSSESQKLFPDNKPYSFTVELPKWLNFSEMSSWILQLTEFHANGVGKNTQKELFVFCNVCGTSVVGEQYRPLLRRIFLEGDKNIIFLRPYEVPIKDNGVRSLNFEIKDKDFQPAFFLTDEVSMTIEFKQKWAFCPCWIPFALKLCHISSGKRDTRLVIRTRSGNRTRKCNLGQQEGDLMDQKKLTCWNCELYKTCCLFFFKVPNRRLNLNKMILAWNFP